MTVQPASSARIIFLAARKLANQQARQSFVEEACEGNSELQATVGQLLRASEIGAESPIDNAAKKIGLSAAPEDLTVTGMSNPDIMRRDTPYAETVTAGLIDASKHPLIGPYKLLEEIGHGGMGAVYMAQQIRPVNRKVALKVIKPGMDTKEVIARFEAERQALAMMDHTNIARVLGGGTTDEGRPYFVMELVRGVPLTEFCKTKNLNLQGRLKLFIDVCRAVQHAHQKGIIHRDLKPSNLLVTLYDGVPVVKVIDFGIAKALNQELTERTFFTHYSQMLGTPLYMAPEQAEMSGLDIDTRSDIYALGVVLYELLTGTTPFDRDTLSKLGVDGIRKLIREQDPPRPSIRVSTLKAENQSTLESKLTFDTNEIARQLNRELDWIVMKALEKDRERRYESANAFAADVQRYLNDEPVQACPPSIAYTFRKWMHRNRWMVSIVSTIAVALIVSCTVSIWQVIEVRRAWQASLIREQRANDLLEATQLQTSVAAFRQGDLAKLAVSTSVLAQATHDSDRKSRDTESLASLLIRAATPLPQQIYPHANAVNDFSVSTDQTRMVSVDAIGQVRLWNLMSPSGGKILGTHQVAAHAVAISPDGTKAVSGATNGSVCFWDLNTGDLLTQLQPFDAGIETIVWSPDSRYIAAGARYNQTWVCDADGKTRFGIANDQRHEALLFSPDSKRLYVPTRQTVDVWHVESGKRLASFTTAPVDDVRAMCWAGPDQQWLVVGERFSETLVILHRDTGQRLGTVATGLEYAQHLAASPDGIVLAVAYQGEQTQLIQLSESAPDEVKGTVQLHFDASQSPVDAPPEPRWTVRWLDGSNSFLTAGSDGRIRLWNVDEIRPARVLPEISLSPSNRRPVAAYPLGTTELVYYVSGHAEMQDQAYRYDYFGNRLSRQEQTLPMPIHAQSFRPVGHHIVRAGAKQIEIVDLASDQIVGTIQSPFAHHWRVALAANAAVVAASSNDGEVAVWTSGDHWNTAERIGTWHTPHQRTPSIADDGRTLILVNDHHTGITEWDLETGGMRNQYSVPMGDSDVSLSPQGDLLAISVDHGVRVWDRQTSDVVFDVRTRSEATALAFFGDDRVLVSAHRDETIRAWHLPTGQPLGVLFQPTQSMGVPTCLLPVEDGNTLLVWYDNQTTLQVVVLGLAAVK